MKIIKQTIEQNKEYLYAPIKLLPLPVLVSKKEFTEYNQQKTEQESILAMSKKHSQPTLNLYNKMYSYSCSDFCRNLQITCIKNVFSLTGQDLVSAFTTSGLPSSTTVSVTSAAASTPSTPLTASPRPTTSTIPNLSTPASQILTKTKKPVARVKRPLR